MYRPLSSGDVVCIRERDLVRGIGTLTPEWTWEWDLVGKLAVVLCKTTLRGTDTFFDNYVYVLIAGQLFELWLGTNGIHAPDATLVIVQ